MYVCVCVAGPPLNCSILSAVSHSSSSLTLNITCFDGHSPITGYHVRFKKTSSSVWKARDLTANSNNAQEVVLVDLEADTQYDVQVQARNKHGYETGIGSFSTITKAAKTATS